MKLIAKLQNGKKLPTAPSAKERFKDAIYVADDDWLPKFYYHGEPDGDVYV
jgi:hypothetical protein